MTGNSLTKKSFPVSFQVESGKVKWLSSTFLSHNFYGKQTHDTANSVFKQRKQRGEEEDEVGTRTTRSVGRSVRRRERSGFWRRLNNQHKTTIEICQAAHKFMFRFDFSWHSFIPHYCLSSCTLRSKTKTNLHYYKLPLSQGHRRGNFPGFEQLIRNSLWFINSQSPNPKSAHYNLLRCLAVEASVNSFPKQCNNRD